MDDARLAKLAKGLAELVTEGRTISAQAGSLGLADTLEHRIKDWIAKATKLAEEVNADSVSITGGFPLGVSVSVSFSLPKPRGVADITF